MGSVVPIDKLTAKKRRQIIDEFGDVTAEIKLLNQRKERYEQLRDQIGSWYADKPANESFLESGDRYTVEIGERAKERKITSMQKLQRHLGLKQFLNLCSFALSVLDKHVPENLRSQFVSEGQTGSRRLKPVPIVTSKEAA